MKSGFDPNVNEPDLKFKITVDENTSDVNFQGQRGKLDYRKSRASDLKIPFKMGKLEFVN